jgi:hypothetical protein
VTLECSVSPSPQLTSLLTTPPLLDLIRGAESFFTTSGFNFSYTLDPVLASQAGTYYCRSVVEVEGLDEPLVSQSPDHILTVFIPPPPHVELTAPARAEGGSSVTLNCSVTQINSSFPVSLTLSLIQKEESVQTTSGFELSYTLDPVLASQAGTYYCRVMVEIQSLDEPLVSQSPHHILTISSKK